MDKQKKLETGKVWQVIASLAIPNEALKVSRTLFFTYYTFFGYSLVGSTLAIYIMSIFTTE